MEEDKKMISAPAESEKGESESRKIKNLISAVILLAGLLAGSLFVDVAQMIRGRGFSQKALDKVDVFSIDGKTWVAYQDPVVRVKVITDDACEECNPDEVLVWMRRILPTMLAEKMDASSETARPAAAAAGVKTIPAFIFSSEIEKTDFYAQAQPIFKKTEAGYVLQTAELGIPVGRYLETPPVAEDDIQTGNKDAKVKVIEYLDFQCPYCKTFQASTMSRLISEYQDRVLFVHKNFPLDSNSQSQNAALAVFCANEQGKFLEYSDKLFENQNDWGQAQGTQKFKNYASQLRLNASLFNQCLDEKRYQEKISRDYEEGVSFGITGTPSVFIGDSFHSGVAGPEELKKIIEEKLAE